MRPHRKLGRALLVALAALVLVPGAVSAGNGNGNANAKGKDAALGAALAYLQQHKHELGLTGADIKDAVVTDLYTDAHNGVTHVYLQQQHKGIAVQRSSLGVHITSDGTVASVANRFVPNLAAQIRGESARQDARAAVVRAARELGLAPARTPGEGKAKGGPAQETVFDGAALSMRPIPAKLVYVPTDSGVRLAWSVQIEAPSGLHWWDASVDADTGELLLTNDMVDDASYNVFALPKESPSDGPRTIETDPHDTDASPFGWHDTDGAAGAEFTTTRGNNVLAATDLDANNVPDPGSSPDGGAGLTFDFGLDLALQPDTYRQSAVTNLFYYNNIIHDVTYGYGFTEAAGNFQLNNYGNGGIANDAVNADAQDGSGVNNANFGTNVDGIQPRMQMFVWTPPALVQVTAPAAAVGTYDAGTAAFGPALTGTGITGTVVQALDPADAAGPTTFDACSAITNGAAVAGNIAIVDRGTCAFTIKVKNAQNAGAIAVIVADNVTGAAAGMAGADATITIPSVRVTQADGNLFKANLPLTATLKKASDINRDSDLDNGVIAHEYMHGISNRLTGGPNVIGCLNSAVDLEHMGEGWSDFLALVMTTDPSDTATTSRGIGTYVSFQPTDGIGIRPTQYTTDMAVNPSTYDTIKNPVITQPHGVGYVWATMLWEVYWNLVQKHGYNADIYADWHTAGNNLAIQLVMDGLKLQPCHPGFVDGRNAILAADLVLTGGANQCEIWNGFAKRGLGTGANQGLSTNRTDGTQDFGVPTACSMTGFFGGVKNDPQLNKQKSGATAAVTFSLGVDKGLGIFDAGYPAYRSIDCVTKQPTSGETPAAVPAGNSLTYDPVLDRYTYPWKTPKDASGCAMLILQFSDDSRQVAYFDFRP